MIATSPITSYDEYTATGGDIYGYTCCDYYESYEILEEDEPESDHAPFYPPLYSRRQRTGTPKTIKQVARGPPINLGCRGVPARRCM
jgi:hypothetical protein